MIPCNSYYGSFRTRTFADIFPTQADFSTAYTQFMLSDYLKVDTFDLIDIYFILYSRYGNSHIAYSDENQFTAALITTIGQYGPTWRKKLELQHKLRELKDEELFSGGKAIYNHAYNPSTEPGTSTLEELRYINDQNTTNYKKSKLEGYSLLLATLENDVTEEFISKFKKLFIQVLAPDYPLLYATEVEND